MKPTSGPASVPGAEAGNSQGSGKFGSDSSDTSGNAPSDADAAGTRRRTRPVAPKRDPKPIQRALAADRAWIIAASKEPGWPQNSPRAAAYRAQKAETTPRESRARRDPYVDWQVGAEHDVGDEWRDQTTRELLEAVVALPDREAAERFFRDLCTLRELHDMAQRWRVVQLLNAGWHYLAISRETGASTATVTRISQWLRHGTGGYSEALERGAGLDPSLNETPEENT